MSSVGLAIHERFLLLAHLVEDLEDEKHAALKALTRACMSTVRHLRGQVDAAEARIAIDNANGELLAVSKAEIATALALVKSDETANTSKEGQ